jgi:ATP-dependent Clp protease adaptor protein ClpS
MSEFSEETDHSTVTESRQKTKKPRIFKVIMLNDNYTTMEFVVYVLETIFQKSPDESLKITLNVHEQGSGIAGTYTRSIAESKIASVHRLAEKEGFPLKCTMEPE